MKWTKIGAFRIDKPFTRFQPIFTSSIAIKVTNVSNLKSTWQWAGYLYEFIDTPLGLARVGNRFSIPIADLIIFIPSGFASRYRLDFEKQDWIDSLQLSIYQSDMPLTFEPVINIPSTFGSTTNSTPVPITTSSVALLAANANRKKLIILNNSNQDLYIDLDATASVSDFSQKIPKITASGFVASYELSEYTGAVSGIWATTGTGAALVKEII